MIILALASAFWFADNTEFIKTYNEQSADGYQWEYKGKNEASGVPAILINDKFYLWKLEK